LFLKQNLNEIYFSLNFFVSNLIPIPIILHSIQKHLYVMWNLYKKYTNFHSNNNNQKSNRKWNLLSSKLYLIYQYILESQLKVSLFKNLIFFPIPKPNNYSSIPKVLFYLIFRLFQSFKYLFLPIIIFIPFTFLL
jgi:hypothetical protein